MLQTQSFFASFLPRRASALGGCLVLAAVLAAPLRATNTTISTASTTKQSLGSGDTLNVTTTGSLTVTGNNVAVTATGSSSITNNGTIQQTSVLTGNNAGNGRAIRDNTGNLTLTLTNGSASNSHALIQTADGDAVQMNKAGSTVTVYNYGTINSQNASGGGNQALDFNALNTAVGSNTIYNYSTGVITASEADAIRPGMNGQIFNDGIIKSATTTGSSSDGIDAQTLTGVSVTNAASGSGPSLIEGGRHGITGGNTAGNGAYAMSVTNNAGGTIQGDNGSGINIDGINGNELVTVVNHGTITGNGHDIGNGKSHDGDGVDVDGLVNLTNTGTIKSLNSFAVSGTETSEGVTVGGGTIVNSGTIEGDVAAGNTTAVGRGITLAGVDKDANDNPIPVQGIYGNSSVTNSGLIRGQSDSGIAVLGPNTGFAVSINNQAGGVIEGAGASVATVRIDADNATIVNAGSIINDGGNSKTAISMGSGGGHLTVTGGNAVIVGGIDGGTGTSRLTFDLGAANDSFSHGGAISDFSTVEVLSGAVALNGQNTYAGVTNVGGGPVAASLDVNGTHTGGGAYTIMSNGTLGGTGTIDLADSATEIWIQSGGDLHLAGGPLAVGEGSMQVDGAMTFDLSGSGQGEGELVFAGGGAGTLDLGLYSLLQLNFSSGPTVGEQFELIDMVDGGSHVQGTFAGLANDTVFTEGGYDFRINYYGGTGNDVVLTTVQSVSDASPTALLLGLGALGAAAAGRRLAKQKGAPCGAP